jgi:uncharacterized protein
MSLLLFSVLIFTGSLLAGFLGSLTGLGGGVVLVPLLTLGFHVELHYAIGASLISVIATSSGSAAAYVREGFSNVRIGMFLEIATTCGAIFGAWLASRTPTRGIGIVFGVVLIWSSFLSWRQRTASSKPIQADGWSRRLKLGGTFPVGDGKYQPYEVTGVPAGFTMMFGAGALSGLLGIGSGAVKVLAMDRVMRIPFKVSTTTSNFMIGVTAAASAGIYLRRGYLDPGLVWPVLLGVLAGSLAGAYVLMGVRVRILRLIFSLVILVLGVEMIFNALTGRL